MSAVARLAAFAVVLVLAFAIAFGVGRAVGPFGEPEPAHDDHTSSPAGEAP